MSIFLTETDRVIVQGMTGSEGRKHTTRMLSAAGGLLGLGDGAVDGDLNGSGLDLAGAPPPPPPPGAPRGPAATWMRAYAADHGVQIIGPNCPGIISPARSNVGITPPDITGPGPLGLVSKSGTLTYQLMHELSDLGFTTCIGIGGDPVVGTTHIDALEAFEADPATAAIALIGEVPEEPETIAPAWPMVLPSGAVKPAM